MNTTNDWQTGCAKIKHRGAYLFKHGTWADCRFLVGSENNQQLVSGHKLILAMASPVFDAMFNGTLPEKNDPIQILDVQPEAFVALMEYIYTDRIDITSMDKACELCYVAKKYMLPVVVQRCTEFLWSDLNAKNVCRAFEFAKLFEEASLAERCLQIICSQTNDVLSSSSFEDVELSTVLTILDQECLNIDSEMDLFFALVRYAEKHGHGKAISKEEENEMIDVDASEGPSSADAGAPIASVGGDAAAAAAVATAGTSSSNVATPSFRDALKKLRFLLMTPRQFADNVPKTNLLTQAECFAILMSISSSEAHPMPEGFSTSNESRCLTQTPLHSNPNALNYYHENSQDSHPLFPLPSASSAAAAAAAAAASTHVYLPVANPNMQQTFHVRTRNSTNKFREQVVVPPLGRDMMHDVTETRRFYCIRPIREQIDYFNTSVSDCALTFTVDRNICITGIQVSTQVLGEQSMQSGNLPERYSELLYAHLLDSYGTRLTYTHCTSNVRFDSLLEISFDHPVQIHRDRFYKIGVAFNKVGWYPMCTCVPTVTCEGVCFDFRVDGPNGESLRDGLIRSIVFTRCGGERD